MNIIYKPLVEILLLHEFYLTESEGNTIFDKTLQADKIDYLINNYNESDIHITDDLSFNPTDLSKSLLRNQHLHISPTYSGFRVSIDVFEQKLQDGTTVYQPKINLPDDLNINILLTKNDNYLDRFSNSRLQRNIPAVYYFSNEDVQGAKTVPSLSNAIAAYDASYAYEMGELAFKDNQVKQFTSDGSANPWIAVTDNGYVNENDRMLVPFQFNFSFDVSDNINQADFTLKDNTGATIKTISASSSTAALQVVALDFSGLPQLLSIADVSSPAVYTLTVSGSNGYSKQFNILFADAATNLLQSWALVNIKPRVQTAGFNLIADDGYLVTRVSAAGVRTEAPVFEIRIKSRLAYWCYRSNNSSYNLKTSTTTQDFLTNSNGVLKTNKPRTTTYGPTLFTTDGSTFQNLPNPNYEALLMKDGGQFYKDVLVGQSDMFPVVAV